MKSSRFQYKYRQSASKGHIAVGDILRTSKTFRNYQAYQEYHVSKVNPGFPSGREKFDWVVPGLKLVIEFNGSQHYRRAHFGGISIEEAQHNLKETQKRDELKRKAALDAGWTYIAIPYTVKEVTEAYIIEQYKLNFNDQAAVVSRPVTHWANQYAKVKEKARLYRKEKYQKLKLLKREKSRSALPI